MSEPPRPQLTDEVQAALRAREPAPEPQETDPDPGGHLRYFVAVGNTQHTGIDTPQAVAGILRALADHHDPDH